MDMLWLYYIFVPLRGKGNLGSHTQNKMLVPFRVFFRKIRQASRPLLDVSPSQGSSVNSLFWTAEFTIVKLTYCSRWCPGCVCYWVPLCLHGAPSRSHLQERLSTCDSSRCGRSCEILLLLSCVKIRCCSLLCKHGSIIIVVGIAPARQCIMTISKGWWMINLRIWDFARWWVSPVCCYLDMVVRGGGGGRGQV